MSRTPREPRHPPAQPAWAGRAFAGVRAGAPGAECLQCLLGRLVASEHHVPVLPRLQHGSCRLELVLGRPQPIGHARIHPHHRSTRDRGGPSGAPHSEPSEPRSRTSTRPRWRSTASVRSSPSEFANAEGDASIAAAGSERWRHQDRAHGSPASGPPRTPTGLLRGREGSRGVLAIGTGGCDERAASMMALVAFA
jgi:hypothetical protein